MRTKTYIINMPQNKSVIFHGITFKNFISSLSTLLDNIMIITCSNGLLFSDSEIKHGFEWVNWGRACFCTFFEGVEAQHEPNII